MTWDELKSHPFWQLCEFSQSALPPQPHFDNYLKSKGLTLNPYVPQVSAKEEKAINTPEIDKKKATPSSTGTKKTFQPSYEPMNTAATYSSNKTPTSNFDIEIKNNVNVVRMSMNITKNLKKESAQSGYDSKESKETNNTDVKLLNKDQEIDFGDVDDDDDDDEPGSGTGDSGQDEGSSEEDPQTNAAPVTKIEFSKKPGATSTKSPRAITPSAKPIQTVKTNNRNIKPESDVSIPIKSVFKFMKGVEYSKEWKIQLYSA